MTIQTISDIRSAKNTLKISIKNIDIKNFSEEVYGQESEYNIKGVLAGLDAIITDLNGLLKTPKQFLQISSFSERQLLLNILVSISNAIELHSIGEVANLIEELKPLLRTYAIRYTDERLHAFIERTNELQKEIQALSALHTETVQHCATVKDIVDGAEALSSTIKEQCETLGIKKTELDALITASEEVRADINVNFESDKSNSQEIEHILGDVLSHKDEVESFSSKIAARDLHIEKQNQQSDTFVEQLTTHSKEQKDYLDSAEKLITSAKQALEYKTAEGLSAAFITQHDKITGMKAWIICAGILLFCSLGLGIWLTVGSEISISLIIARISLLPILIGSAIFCAGQYVKQKNIADDYAYKAVLAKSLVGFSEQLSSEGSKGDEYKLYISTVLSQLLVDPQRKKNQSNRGSEADYKDILNSLNELPKIVNKLSKTVA